MINWFVRNLIVIPNYISKLLLFIALILYSLNAMKRSPSKVTKTAFISFMKKIPRTMVHAHTSYKETL